jgi:ABC-type antimicrobial peptide transport system permease subunit
MAEIFAMPFMMNYAISRPLKERQGQYSALYSMSFGIANITAPILGLGIADKYGFVICSTDATKLATINKVHNIFGKFFLFIELFFLLIAIIFIVNVGLTTIKKNRYDIGVLKAIGIRNYDIMRIFIRQTIIMCFAICIVTNIGIYFGTMVGNYILVSAFEEILDITFYDLKLISYIPKIVATDLIYIGISCLISFIIPQLLLFRIKPIDIIRAKE